MSSLEKIKAKVKKLSATKPQIDFITAALSIPVLITAVILNFSSLETKISSSKITVTPTPSITVSQSQPVLPSTKPVIQTVVVTLAPQPSASQSCTPGIGNISIASPQEGQTVTQNPVCINIDYQSENSCAVVWAYRVNNGPLSDYGNNSVCLYSLPAGQVTFELDVKSLVNNDTKTVTRTFSIPAPPTPTATPTTITTPSPTLTPMSP
ncbi:MAG TPA: hypothetical protein VGT05_03875 [Patescibacteria group bacterium]|nr:hypothetical protein [Patescibacteria group bacterium]